MPIGSDVLQTTYASLAAAKPRDEREVKRGKRKMLHITMKQIRKKQQGKKRGQGK